MAISHPPLSFWPRTHKISSFDHCLRSFLSLSLSLSFSLSLSLSVCVCVCACAPKSVTDGNVTSTRSNAWCVQPHTRAVRGRPHSNNRGNSIYRTSESKCNHESVWLLSLSRHRQSLKPGSYSMWRGALGSGRQVGVCNGHECRKVHTRGSAP
jgi:hypothetical protein